MDDIIARGSSRQTKLFWADLATKYSLKMVETVDYDNPLVYTGYTIGKVLRGDTQWYTMDMASDITAFLLMLT